MHEILQTIKQITESILKKEFKSLKDLEIPKKQGVYIIKDVKKDHVFYVGKSRNLFNRIIRHHNSKSNGDSSSVLRRKLNKQGFEYDKISDYLENNCLFIIKEIEDFDINGLVEELLITLLRKQGEPLLNIYK